MLIPSPFLNIRNDVRHGIYVDTSSLSMWDGSHAPPIQDSVVQAVIDLARGGALELFAHNKASTLDISRVRMRLEGLQVYATLCALLTNACLRLYSSVKISDQRKEERHIRIALDLFYLCVVISVLFGSYTTIVFGLFSLLSKTALGRGYDDQFLEFWRHSTDIRESGFESFLYSLVSFELSFVISLFLRFQGRRRVMLVVIACAILSMSMTRWSRLLFLASKYLFPLRAEMEY